MVENPRGITTEPARRPRGRDLPRLAGWGLSALGAVTLAAYAVSFPAAEDRLILAVAEIRGTAPPARLVKTPAPPPSQQFAETVRELSDDRDRLLARLDSLERNLGDLTGSIARTAWAPPVAAVPPPAAAIPPLAAAVPPLASAVPPPAVEPPAPAPIIAAPEIVPVPRPQPSEEPAAAKAEFGIDIGRANSLEGLRQLWTSLKGKHATLESLRPIVSMRELAKSGGIELRLVAGPVPNAAAAARLCANLSGVACHPTTYDGQKLVLR